MKLPWKFTRYLGDTDDSAALVTAADDYFRKEPPTLFSDAVRDGYMFGCGFVRGAQWRRDKPAHVARPLVIVESPYAGDVELNLRYLRAAMRDCLLRGEAPFASHALYTQPGVFDDNNPDERRLGIEAGFAFRHAASKTVAYTDLGLSKGMQLGLDHARELGHEVELRTLPGFVREVLGDPCSEASHNPLRCKCPSPCGPPLCPKGTCGCNPGDDGSVDPGRSEEYEHQGLDALGVPRFGRCSATNAREAMSLTERRDWLVANPQVWLADGTASWDVQQKFLPGMPASVTAPGKYAGKPSHAAAGWNPNDDAGHG